MCGRDARKRRDLGAAGKAMGPDDNPFDHVTDMEELMAKVKGVEGPTGAETQSNGFPPPP